MKKIITNIIFIILFIVIARNILMMPGDLGLESPAYNDAIYHYLENSASETGAVNIIAAILADYRAFDTLGETIVLFISIVAVASILKPAVKEEEFEVICIE
jgi:multisubunit Na+/H+ antiporter MnhB subunit